MDIVFKNLKYIKERQRNTSETGIFEGVTIV